MPFQTPQKGNLRDQVPMRPAFGLTLITTDEKCHPHNAESRSNPLAANGTQRARPLMIQRFIANNDFTGIRINHATMIALAMCYYIAM
jgi:hypothetical protein